MKDILYFDYVDTKEGMPCYHLGVPKPNECPYCGSDKINKHSNVSKTLGSIAPDGSPELIEVEHNRYQCKDCKRAFIPDIVLNDYSEDFYSKVLDMYTSTDISVEELAPEVFRNKWTGNLLRDYINRRSEYSKYELPENLGLVFIQMAGSDVVVLTDVRDLSIIDVIRKKDLENLDLSEVRSIILDDSESLPFIRKVYNGKIICRDYDFLFEALIILEEELQEYNAYKESLTGQEIRQIIDGKDTDHLQKKSAEDLGLIPFLTALKALKRFTKEPEQLRKIKTGLERFDRYLKKAENYSEENAEGLRPELLDEYYKRIEKFKEEASSFKRRRASINQIRGSILFNRNPKRSITSDEDQVLLEFKRRL